VRSGIRAARPILHVDVNMINIFRGLPPAPVPRDIPVPADAVVYGAHRFSGSSTLSALLPARNAGLACDTSRQRPLPGWAGAPVVLACRSSAWAAPRAVVAARTLAQAGAPVTVLAIIGDGWPESDAATERFREASPYVGRVVRLPFVPALRYLGPQAVRLPRDAIIALQEVKQSLAVAPASSVPPGSGGTGQRPQFSPRFARRAWRRAAASSGTGGSGRLLAEGFSR
jgi:hypothetical protein